MPKFFLPAAEDDAQAERVRNSVITFAKTNGFQPREDVRIFKLYYRHDGRDYEAEVGKAEPRTGEPVVMILWEETPRDLFLICTENRGVVRGEPVLVGRPEVRSVVEFD